MYFNIFDKLFFNNGMSVGDISAQSGGGENYLGSHSTRPPF